MPFPVVQAAESNAGPGSVLTECVGWEGLTCLARGWGSPGPSEHQAPTLTAGEGRTYGTFICSRPSELCFPQEKGNVAAGTQEAGKNVVLGLTDLQKPQESTLRKCLFCPHRNTEKWDLKPHRAKGCL